MALGKQIAEFSGKSTSITIGSGPGNVSTFQVNMEGTVSLEGEEGTYVLTYHTEGELGAKSGTWSWDGLIIMKAGTSVGFRGQGTWEESGAGHWRYRGTGQLTDGRTYAYEFEGDWATRTWAGKAFEWS